MALEEMCARQNSEIMHLNRLVSGHVVKQPNKLYYKVIDMILSRENVYRSSNTNMRESVIP